MSEFTYSPLLPTGKDDTPFKCISTDYVKTIEIGGRTFIEVDPAGLTFLAEQAMADVSHLLRPEHLAQARILDDPESTHNDRFVALEMLKNAVISAERILPMCQDTGTALINAERGERMLTGGTDDEALSRGIYNTYQSHNLRFSQLAPLSMFEEKNTANNLPAD